MKNKLILLLIPVLIMGCDRNNYPERKPQSIVMSSIKHKGVLISGNYDIYDGYSLVIRTNDDVIEEPVTESVYKFLILNDTIK